jgi:DNA ligase (NAD+)
MCITGSFIWDDGNKISRDDLVEKLEKVWGSFVSSVSKNTDFLLAWEKAGSKFKKAEENNVPIISLQEFLNEVE